VLLHRIGEMSERRERVGVQNDPGRGACDAWLPFEQLHGNLECSIDANADPVMSAPTMTTGIRDVVTVMSLGLIPWDGKARP
jgi:hypothetical protein